MYLAIGRWQGAVHAGSLVWQPPAGAVASFDLRPLAQQSVAPTDGAQGGVGLFGFDADPSGQTGIIGVAGADPLGTLTSGQKSALAQACGLTARGLTIDSTRLGAAIWECLTAKADPTGLQGPKPLMPGRALLMEIVFGPYSFQSKFDLSNLALRPGVLAVLKADYARIRTAHPDLIIPRKVLGAWLRKFAVSDPTIFQAGTTDAALDPTTTITESFPGSTGFGGDLTWTQINGTWANSSNQGTVTGAPSSADTHARAESALSGADHNATVDYITGTGAFNSFGPSIRRDPTANSAYVGWLYSAGNLALISKIVTGTRTNLTSVSYTRSLPETVKLDATGTTLTLSHTGGTLTSVTDSTFTTQLYTGLFDVNDATFDNFSATDGLGGGTTLSFAAFSGTWTKNAAKASVTGKPVARSATWSGWAAKASVTQKPATRAAAWTGRAAKASVTLRPAVRAATWSGHTLTVLYSLIIAFAAAAATWTGRSLSVVTTGGRIVRAIVTGITRAIARRQTDRGSPESRYLR